MNLRHVRNVKNADRPRENLLQVILVMAAHHSFRNYPRPEERDKWQFPTDAAPEFDIGKAVLFVHHPEF